MDAEIKVFDNLEYAEGPAGQEALTPVQKTIVEQTNPVKEYTLSSGKKVSFRKPAGLSSFTIAQIMGPDSANPALTMYYRVLFCVCAFEGAPVRTPTSKLQAEALATRLGEDFDEVVVKWSLWQGLSIPGLEGEGEAEAGSEHPAKK